MAKVAILGHGVVGSGVAEVLRSHSESITRKAGMPIEIKYILDVRDFSQLPYGELFIKDFDTILNDPEVRIVVEVLGGTEPAYRWSKAALEAGKSVVTSNKEVVAEYGAELVKLARDKNVNYLFEASVGGGIPIIRPLSQCLAANEVEGIAGILNGTTNYILTQMIRHGATFDTALAEAQRLGYAEQNPTADVDGIDACRKICILSSLAFSHHVYPRNVHTEGIRQLTLRDVECAEHMNSVIKLLGVSKRRSDGKLAVLVAPFLVDKECPLSNVEDVFNGIMVRGDSIGDVMFYGRGAGKLPTASAVVADVIDAAKHFASRKYIFWDDLSNEEFVIPFGEMEHRFFVRLNGHGAALLREAGAFGDVTVAAGTADSADELCFVTPLMKESDFAERVAHVGQGCRTASNLRIFE